LRTLRWNILNDPMVEREPGSTIIQINPSTHESMLWSAEIISVDQQLCSGSYHEEPKTDLGYRVLKELIYKQGTMPYSDDRV